MPETTTPLAQMSPDDLRRNWERDHSTCDLGTHFHALIQRATREAREGHVSRTEALGVVGDAMASVYRERDEARALADRLQGERDTLAWDVGVAERKLASEGRDALTKLAEGEARKWVGSAMPVRVITEFRDTHYPPSPREAVPSVRIGEWTVTYNAKGFVGRDGAKWRGTRCPRGTGWHIDRPSLVALLDYFKHDPTVDEYAALVALATGGE